MESLKWESLPTMKLAIYDYDLCMGYLCMAVSNIRGIRNFILWGMSLLTRERPSLCCMTDVCVAATGVLVLLSDKPRALSRRQRLWAAALASKLAAVHVALSQ